MEHSYCMYMIVIVIVIVIIVYYIQLFICSIDLLRHSCALFDAKNIIKKGKQQQTR